MISRCRLSSSLCCAACCLRNFSTLSSSAALAASASLVLLSDILPAITLSLRSSPEFAVSKSLFALWSELSSRSRAVFFASRIRSFRFFCIFRSCLALSLRALSSSPSASFLYTGDSSHIVQLRSHASTAASAVSTLFRIPISRSSNSISFLILQMVDSKAALLILHRPRRSLLDFWREAISAASLNSFPWEDADAWEVLLLL